MSEQNSRRRFLAATVLGGAGVVSASALTGLVAKAATLDQTDEQDDVGINQPDPYFLEGLVVSVAESAIIVLTNDLVLRRVLATGTQVWKVRVTTLERVQVGDRLYARGVPMEDGSFAATNIWANIVNLVVRVAGTSESRLELEHRGKQWTGHLQPDTIVRYSGRAPSRDFSRVRPGSHVQIVGAWRPNTNDIDVSTVFA